MSKITLNPAAVGLELLAPNGSAIRGTWDMLPGKAEAATVDSYGDPEYQGSTDLVYDEQKTVCCAETGESLWIDGDGELWRQSQLRAWVEDAEESIPLYLPEDSARNGNDAEPHKGMEEIGGQYLVDSGDYRALKARVAALEAALDKILDRYGIAMADGFAADVAEWRALLDSAPAAEADDVPSSDHPRFADWQAEVAAGDTMRGFADWLAAKAEEEAEG